MGLAQIYFFVYPLVNIFIICQFFITLIEEIEIDVQYWFSFLGIDHIVSLLSSWWPMKKFCGVGPVTLRTSGRKPDIWCQLKKKKKREIFSKF